MDANDPELNRYDAGASQELYQENQQKAAFAEIVKLYTKALLEYGLTLEDLVKVSPKHRDSKERLIKASYELSNQPILLEYMKQHKMLPLKELQNLTGLKRKVSMRAEMLKDNMFGHLMVAEVDQNIQQEAAQLGLNINNYLIYSKFAQKDNSADPLVFSTDNIPNILSKANVSLENLYPQESCQIKPPNSTNPQTMPMEKNADRNHSGQPRESIPMNPMPQQPQNPSMPDSVSFEHESEMDSMNSMR